MADFYRYFTSEAGCCFPLTALNENQLRALMCAHRMCLRFSHQVFLGKTWPRFLTKLSRIFFSYLSVFSTPSSLLCFVYSPWSSPTCPFFFSSSLLQTHNDSFATCVPASDCCVYHTSICLHSPHRELVLFGEAKENSNVDSTPHQQPRWMTELVYARQRWHT